MNKKNRVGEKWITNQGYQIEIVEYFGACNCTVLFDSGLKLYGVAYSCIKKGMVSNPFYPNVCNIGFIGVGIFKTLGDNRAIKSSNLWRAIIQRCYDINHLLKSPTYKDCSVDERWHCFQDFAEWYETSYKPHMEKWHLDKDILVKGNKIYSPERCCFVHGDINVLFTKREARRGNLPIGVVPTTNGKYVAQINIKGRKKNLGTHFTKEEAFQAYKIAKEAYIREVAEEWRHLIEENVYQSLINYQVEITD